MGKRIRLRAGGSLISRVAGVPIPIDGGRAVDGFLAEGRGSAF